MWLNYPNSNNQMREIEIPAQRVQVQLHDREEVPEAAKKFLEEKGWIENYALSTSIFEHNDFSGYFPWSEAVAMEMIRFMRIGVSV